ncbi:isopenicillin N synthase family dioxygenase [Fluviispira multicolorata]|uniref:isopenicillin N synthase family dioxygenase n=1 Tax=Fluviispira multicolorata TaxID=2654512 RepID=UPI001478D9AF|nr:isopenicillin N synthase family oxygenase [Fluviispira multicolorata]
MKKVPLTDVKLYTQGSLKEKEEFIKVFGHSLQEFGFVIIEGHNISANLINESYTLIKEVFSLPIENKLKYVENSGLGQRGYVHFGLEHAKNSFKGDLKEFWHIGREHFLDEKFKNEYAKNIWPDSHLPHFKPKILDLYNKLDQLSQILLSSLSEYLNLPKYTLPQMAMDGNSVLRALHYPPLKQEQFSSGAVRAAAHEDINLITILCEATESGLEILTRKGHWLEIECKQGQMIIDSGDMLSRITNNVIPSTTHRVINPKGIQNVSRYSMPFFVHAFEKCELNVLENCKSPSKPTLYPPILANEFLLQRLRENGLGKI